MAAAGHPFHPHAFQRGADIVPLMLDERLEAGLLGDMPTLMVASTGMVSIVGLVKQTATAIVMKGDAQVRDLAGLRVGYVEASSAHHTLLQGLSSAGLDEKSVQLRPLRINEMPDALERREIDAFAGWEPAPSLALARSNANRVVFRGRSSDYFVLGKRFIEKSPDAAHTVIAGFFRAIDWMRRSRANLEQAAAWVKTDGAGFSGKPMPLGIAQIAAITRREILDIPSAPALPAGAGTQLLRSEFEFLQRLGKLPAKGTWKQVEGAFAFGGLARVQSEARKYRLASFDYGD